MPDERGVFVSISTGFGTLSGLLLVPPTVRAQDVLDLRGAMEEAVAEVVSDWMQGLTGKTGAEDAP